VCADLPPIDCAVALGDFSGQGSDCTTAPPPCAGDLDGNGMVNTVDLVNALAAWGACPTNRCHADIDGDGMIDLTDILALFAAWGPC